MGKIQPRISHGVTRVKLMDPSATLEVKVGVMDDFVQNESQKKTGVEMLRFVAHKETNQRTQQRQMPRVMMLS